MQIIHGLAFTTCMAPLLLLAGEERSEEVWVPHYRPCSLLEEPPSMSVSTASSKSVKGITSW